MLGNLSFSLLNKQIGPMMYQLFLKNISNTILLHNIINLIILKRFRITIQKDNVGLNILINGLGDKKVNLPYQLVHKYQLSRYFQPFKYKQRIKIKFFYRK